MNYIQLLRDRDSFKKASGYLAESFNILDQPGHHYFKIFFHFNNGDSDFGENHGGLLALPNTDIPLINNQSVNYDPYKQLLRRLSSAWSYLVQNYEDERARLLLIFINLLTNISIDSPWYFLKISGLDAALERKLVYEGMKLDEARQKITLTCLPDAIDERIGTLLDLYRSIVYSWLLKKEIVPANLRKFDMSICIFETPFNVGTISLELKDQEGISSYYKTTINKSQPTISYKYIELHNCEIDYSSPKSTYAELNNADGFNPEYNMDIFFDDIYESRYNQWANAEIGDMIYNDSSYAPYNISDSNIQELLKTLEKINNIILGSFPEKSDDDKQDKPFRVKRLTNRIENKIKEKSKSAIDKLKDKTKLGEIVGTKLKKAKDKFINGAKEQLIEYGKGVVENLINKAKLGSIAGFSSSNAIDKLKDFASGNILNSAKNLGDVVRRYDEPLSKFGPLGNLFEEPNNELEKVDKLKKLGNLYKNISAKNNI